MSRPETSTQSINLAALEVPESVKQVCNHTISSNHCVGENSILKVVDLFQSKHGLLLKVLESLVLGLSPLTQQRSRSGRAA